MTNKREVHLTIGRELPASLGQALEDICALDGVDWTYREIPEPNRVQEFRVRVETASEWNPVTLSEVEESLLRFETRLPGGIALTVTEVEPA